MWEQFELFVRQQPPHMIMDFEGAAVNAFQAEWPTTTMKGCYALLF